MRPAGRRFVVLVALGVALEAAMAGLVWRGVDTMGQCYWAWWPGAPAGHVQPAVCREPIVGVGFDLFVPVAVLGALLVATVVSGVIAAVGSWRAARRVRSMLGPPTDVVAEPLALAAKRAGVGAVELHQHAEPYALCIGLARPVVVVSTALLEMLSSEELMAVLAHEQRHRRRRAPLRELAATATARALFFLPTLGDLADAHSVCEEVVADHEAVIVAGRRPLVRALAKLTDVAMLMPQAAAITGTDALGARLHALHHGSLPSLQLHRRRLVLSISAATALLLVAIWMPGAGAWL
ncbi:MAG: M56 family metallopeptidase [Actinomycetota bacterium]|jgi:beta-lactamase regulating signal transducer with metallopeptidase domain|nr:M56 family metallopeptidase [Actinomycetota bacterium]